MRNIRWAAVVLMAVAWPALARADAVADFYAHHPIRMLIGYTTGGGYDLYARLLARFMGRHIPGKPDILPENMPGAGSLRAANYLYLAAPKDGTAIGTFSRGLAMEALLNHSQGVQFDAPKFTWLGSISDEVSVCAFTAASGIRSWDDMRAKPFSMGGTASGSDSDIFATVLRNLFDLKMKLVTGFPGGADVDLAMRRGEVDGRCGWSWSSLISRDKQMLDDKQIYVTLQIGGAKAPDAPDAPLITQLTEDPQKAAVLKLIVSRQAMARPFAAPPGIPADRAAALRAAFDDTMKDPEFIAEAKKLELEVRPVDGATLTKLVQDIYATPPDALKLAAQAVK